MKHLKIECKQPIFRPIFGPIPIVERLIDFNFIKSIDTSMIFKSSVANCLF